MMTKITRRKIGVVAVNSGQILILDPCNYATVNYDACVKVANGGVAADWRQVGCGVVARTALGDGLFPVHALYRDNQLIGFEVRFD